MLLTLVANKSSCWQKQCFPFGYHSHLQVNGKSVLYATFLFKVYLIQRTYSTPHHLLAQILHGTVQVITGHQVIYGDKTSTEHPTQLMCGGKTWSMTKEI